MSTPSQAAISWSAGKDACLAWRRALAQGLSVTTFLTMMDDQGHSKSHALPRALIAAQVQRMGGQWWPAEVAPGTYIDVFRQQLQGLRNAGHTHVVFGDIDLQAHRDFLEPACASAGLVAVFPLWGQSRQSVAQAIVDEGIEARLACVDGRWLDRSYCGQRYDSALLNRLPAEVCPCGEGGEFHTVVVNAPGFSSALPIRPAEVTTVSSMPPLSPTTLWVQRWSWDDTVLMAEPL